MIHLTADLHLGHAGVIEYCARPFASVAEMDAALVANYNQRVKDDDTVYFLGDICFHKPTAGIPVLSLLRGRKILIRGNHDQYSNTQYYRAGFSAVLESAVIKVAKQRVALSHYPPYHVAEAPREDGRFLHRRVRLYPGGFGVVICGHVHKTWLLRADTSSLCINVGVDQWGYSPVPIGKIESLIGKYGIESRHYAPEPLYISALTHRDPPNELPDKSPPDGADATASAD